MAKQLVPRPAPALDLYEADFYSWCLDQAAAARAGELHDLDLTNIAEELEGLAKDQARTLRSSYRVLLHHLLKWRHQPKRRARSWSGSVIRERADAVQCLADNPGLKQHQRRLFDEAYGVARRLAANETGLPLTAFPVECPFTLEQALDDEFWPEAA